MTPIVLHHGLLGSCSSRNGSGRISYFKGLDAALARRGYCVIATEVHPTAGIGTRAGQLKQDILTQLEQIGRAGEPVVIVAHSMGGLDARYMISKLGMQGRVKALLTVATPHRGSAYADWFLHHVGHRLGGLQLMDFIGWDVQAVSDLTTARCRQFNDEVVDSPRVRYFSISAARPWHKIPPFALLSHKVIFEAEGENDGLVSVKSSAWGEHLGVWAADHWHTINRRLVPEFKNPTGDIVPYYLRALARMREAGVEGL